MLTFKEDLGREDFDGILAIAQVLHRGVVQHMLVGLSLQDRLFAAHELLLGILLQISGVHSSLVSHSNFLGNVRNMDLFKDLIIN